MKHQKKNFFLIGNTTIQPFKFRIKNWIGGRRYSMKDKTKFKTSMLK